MKNIWIVLLLLPLNLHCQHIAGTVKEMQTGKGIEFATIYVSSTTSGTLSNANGQFSFHLRGIQLPCQLVVSHVSYLNEVIQINDTADLHLTIRLRPKMVEIPQVNVVERGFRKNNIRHFKTLFLGNDAWGRNAVLENDSVLIFDAEYFAGDSVKQGQTGKRKSFTVRSTAPLHISLPDLGYDLQVDLISFTEKYLTESDNYLISTLGYFYFKPVETDSKYRQNRYETNRLKAYYFSPMHFTRSLFENKLTENGYVVYFHEYSEETKRYNNYIFNPDSSMTFTSDTAIVTGYKNHCFRVSYYCNSRGFPVNRDVKDPYEFKRSAICFLNDTCVIRKDGTRPGVSVFFGPGLGDKRIGAMLPGDYQPETNK